MISDESKAARMQNLEFAPIEFGDAYLSGSAGTMGKARNFVRSALPQNILSGIGIIW